MPIALLKFPTDLLRDVFKQCNPFELYCLSKCSKRARNSVKSGGKMNWKISYWGSKEIGICGDGWNYFFEANEEPENYFKRWQLSHKYMSIEFPNGGGVELFIYLIDTLGICIVRKLLVQFVERFDNISKVAKVLMERDMEIEILSIGFFQDVQVLANFMPLINQMRITKEFELGRKFPPDFHYQLVNYPSYIQIIYAFWFDINQLLSCTSTRIVLGDSVLSNQDLNVFFRKWKTAGAFPNLQCLIIMSENIDNKSAILDMVPPITTVENPRKQVSIQFGGDQNDEVMTYDAVQIFKEDGTEAWLKVELGTFRKLEFLVCNPDNTKVEDIELSDEEEEFEDEEVDDEGSDGEEPDNEGADDEKSNE
ncbi:hypothetical protein B9Z55_003704 [Caenorhabditis nigoni]|uniref:F-box domain-containing protein n=1 Tax=Caenorhabditis nigoni TaxID=1611254 RepID=A0A2G5VRL5_9PELO|nr:hypothetical protein B9Z55_003704 [Caenorhabditis nigoni]